MRIDVHCHLLGDCTDLRKALNHEDIYYDPFDNPSDLSSFFIKNVVIQEVKKYIKEYGGKVSGNKIPSKDYIDFLYKIFVDSKELDQIVLLAMDATYSNKLGALQEKETDLFITNEYLYNKVNELNEKLDDEGHTKKRFLFGASVNPNKPKWKEDLEYVCKDTDAVLLKLIPSVHDVEIWNDKHAEFYKMLKEYELPLLCHVGPELAFAQGLNNKTLDNFRFLSTPLEYGVKVIAAHLASPYFPGQENELIEFADFMHYWNRDGEIRLWADISAVTTSFRVTYMKRYIQDFPAKWLVNGSDMPVPVEPKVHLPRITYGVSFDEFFDFINEENPFDMDIKIKKAHGFDNSIFSNAENVLRIKIM